MANNSKSPKTLLSLTQFLELHYSTVGSSMESDLHCLCPYAATPRGGRWPTMGFQLWAVEAAARKRQCKLRVGRSGLLRESHTQWDMDRDSGTTTDQTSGPHTLSYAHFLWKVGEKTRFCNNIIISFLKQKYFFFLYCLNLKITCLGLLGSCDRGELHTGYLHQKGRNWWTTPRSLRHGNLSCDCNTMHCM